MRLQQQQQQKCFPTIKYRIVCIYFALRLIYSLIYLSRKILNYRTLNNGLFIKKRLVPSMGKFNKKSFQNENGSSTSDIDWNQIFGDAPHQSIEDKAKNIMSKVKFALE